MPINFKNLNIILLLIILVSAHSLALNAQTSTNKGGKRHLKSIGVQLYTVRKELESDFEGTLRRIADIGYDQVEFAGLFGRDPNDVRKLVKKLGIKIAASHINWEKLKDNPESAIAETKSLGAKYMVLAWFPPEQRETLDQWKDWIKLINRAAKMADERGIRFLYHNHNFEFTKIDGVEPYDLLLDTVDRKYVSFELDIYWLKLAGRDPEPLFARYPKGFPFSHVKDMNETDSAMADVGDGKIDFARIFSANDKSGMKYFIVERDDGEQPFVTLEKSLKYLRELRY